MNNVGKNIRSLREAAHITQDELAEAANLNRVTIAKYEAGKIVPGGKTLAKLAQALHVSVDILLGAGESDMSDEERDLWEMREEMRRKPELRTLYDLQRKASKTELRQMEAFIRAIRSSNDHEEYPD